MYWRKAKLLKVGDEWMSINVVCPYTTNIQIVYFLGGGQGRGGETQKEFTLEGWY